MDITVTVKIPSGDVCREERRCPFLKYSKRHDCHNCQLYGRLLKGGSNAPEKCPECTEYTRKAQAHAD